MNCGAVLAIALLGKESVLCEHSCQSKSGKSSSNILDKFSPVCAVAECICRSFHIHNQSMYKNSFKLRASSEKRVIASFSFKLCLVIKSSTAAKH